MILLLMHKGSTSLINSIFGRIDPEENLTAARSEYFSEY
jgi:hypothetical protein